VERVRWTAAYEYESSCFLVEPPIKSPADLDLCVEVYDIDP
jgi:hypothetical protein